MTLYLHDQFTGIKIVFILFSKVLFIFTWTTKTWYHKCVLKRFSSLRPCRCCCVALCQFMPWHVLWAHRIYTFRMRSKRKAGMNLWNNTQGCSNTNTKTVSKCVDYECVRPLYALTRHIELIYTIGSLDHNYVSILIILLNLNIYQPSYAKTPGIRVIV